MLLIQIINALTHIHIKGAYVLHVHIVHIIICVPSLLGQLAEPHALELLFSEDVPLVEFMYLAFTRTMDSLWSYRRRLRSLLCLCEVFPALKINKSVCDYSVLWFLY